jgi:hypothetical protein
MAPGRETVVPSNSLSGRRLHALTVILIVAALVAGSLLALPSYGLAWDEALGDLFFGHRNIDTEHTLPFDFSRPLPSDGDGRTHPDLFRSPLRNRPWEHWPVMASLSGHLCNLLARGAGWLDPVDAHHLAGVLALALLLPLLMDSARAAWGTAASLAAALALVLHPRMLAASWTDLKDTGTAVFVTLALLFFWRGLSRGRGAYFLAAGLAAGLALGTKANVLFLPLPLATFWLFARPSLPPLKGRGRLALIAAPLLAAGVLLVVWPWLRADPLPRLSQNLGYIFGRGASGSLWPDPWPLLTALASWPLGSLVLVLAGAAAGARALLRREASLEGLALLAAAFPLARLCAPGALSFDGIRHALEFVPPAALLAGAGARMLLASGRRGAAVAALSLALVEPGVELARIHPHEVAHFNPLVGGPAGARRLGFPQVEDYWATGYRRGLAWIDAHAEPGARVAAGVAEHLLFLEGPLRLKPGRLLLRASSPFRSDPGPEVFRRFFAEAGQHPVYLMYVTRESWYGPIVLEAEKREPVYVEGPAGAPMLKVHRFGPAAAP